MNTSGINYMQRSFSGLTGNTRVICLLAVSFSLATGITYGYSLAQVTLFYQYVTLHLATLISR